MMSALAEAAGVLDDFALETLMEAQRERLAFEQEHDGALLPPANGASGSPALAQPVMR